MASGGAQGADSILTAAEAIAQNAIGMFGSTKEGRKFFEDWQTGFEIPPPTDAPPALGQVQKFMFDNVLGGVQPKSNWELWLSHLTVMRFWWSHVCAQ